MSGQYVVIKHFLDRTDNARYYPVGEIYPINDDIEVSDERFNLLVEKGFVKKVKPNTVPLAEYTVKQLKELADKKDIEYNSNIKKAELIALIKE